ncbi:MAG: hypothetical protein AAFV93_25225 [Chloroflexota bacterium]
MSDEQQRDITDEMLLSELTVGEFKALLQSLIPNTVDVVSTAKIDPPIEKIQMRRKSLDEFMNDLGDKK